MSPKTPIIPGQAGLLIPPYGGTLVDLVAKDEERNHLVKRAETLPSLRLSTRALCDLEILAIGGFSPLDRFMRKADYVRTLAEMRLADGTPFPIPITLPAILPAGTGIGSEIVLRSPNNETVAVMLVDEIFERDYVEEPQQVCGTIDVHHPLVAEMASWPRWYVSGSLRVFRLPNHYDFSNIRQSPAAVRIVLERLGHKNVVAFQTRNPIHRAHEELTKLAMEKVNGTLLIQPTVGVTNPGDVDHFTRTRTYQVLVERYYDQKRTVLNLLPLAMRMAGPREAVWHAIIRRNYGANHFIVGRDHASPGVDSVGRPFYETYAAQELLAKFRHEIGITPVPFKEFVYLPHEDRYAERDGVNASAKAVSLSGTEVRLEYLRNGKKLPEWFTRPETAAILARSSPPLHRQGFCVWFTGLSGAGKSTTAEILAVLLMEHGRQVTVLDGDVVRTRLSRGLGFGKEDRDDNIRRIGFVASEVVRHHGAVICATISPYRSTRNEVRAMVGAHRFIEIFVDTPLEVCELRDVKGMYAKARRGQLPGFTGIDDPYEPPVNPEIRLTTTECLPENNARWIVRYLIDRGFLLNHEDERNFS